ncbi:BBSome-interacting protein 1 [Aedes aegypti]|uniref:BBSome-interacting protein 1 n=1 Tax=Aedes aegypti TaxID=7159 RepID=A0A6I8TZ97_AEDAE|nr:BBSome-interacting protein 1 [Aedes aegypti]
MSLPSSAAEIASKPGAEKISQQGKRGGSFHNPQQPSQQQPITLILPTSGKLFYEKKQDFVLCKPQLLPLKSFSLEKLEKMQKEAHRQLQETRARTAASAAAVDRF